MLSAKFFRAMTIMTAITIREVGIREGFQSFSTVYPTEKKLQLIEYLLSTGLKTLEVTSFVRPDKVPQMADAEELCRRLPLREGVSYTVLYLNQHGLRRARATEGPITVTGWLPFAASETFLRKNSNITFAQFLDSIPLWCDTFEETRTDLHGFMVSTCFGCNDEGRIENDRVCSAVDLVLERLATVSSGPPREICVADTMGWGEPRRVADLVRRLARGTGCDVSLHLHDTRGLGMANVMAGIESGVSIFESSVGGIGGCPFARGATGNVATEEIVYLCDQLGVETGVSLSEMKHALAYLEEDIGLLGTSRWYRCEKALRRRG
jgi:hydroxymethylglutaryl-CoA lyase